MARNRNGKFRELGANVKLLKIWVIKIFLCYFSCMFSPWLCSELLWLGMVAVSSVHWKCGIYNAGKSSRAFTVTSTRECHVFGRHRSVSSFFCAGHILEILLPSLCLLELPGSNLQVSIQDSVIYFETRIKDDLLYCTYLLGNCAKYSS